MLKRFAISLIAVVGLLAELGHAEALSWEYLHTEPTSAPRVSFDDIQQAVADTHWHAGEGVASFAYDTEPKWLRYKIPPGDELRIFTLNNAWLVAIDVYLVDGNQVVERYETGTSRPQSNRAVADSGFVFGITPNITDVYIYDHARSASYYPVALRSTNDYSIFSNRLSAFQGLYYGIVLIMILYNLAIFAGSREPAYLYYSLFAASLMLFLSTADGTGSLYLWPETPAMQNIAIAVGWGFCFVFLLEFARHFLRIEKNGRLFRSLRYLQLAVGGYALIIMIWPGPVVFAVQTLLSVAIFSGLLLLGIHAASQKVVNGRLFLIAHGTFVFFCSGHIMMLLGWLEPSVLLQHAIHIGSIAELMLFSIGLIRYLRENDRARYEAFLESQELSRRNRELSTARTLAEEHRQLQKSLQKAQKLKTIGQLAGGFAHDFNNILASILGFAELAQDKTSAADRATLLRYLQEIRKSGERGANLVKQLLVYSRNTASKPTELDVARAINQANDLLRSSLPPTVDIKLHAPKRASKLFMDPEQLQQVLVNLCINAAEAMQDRGQIDIRFDVETAELLHCTSCLSPFTGDFVTIKVEDTGQGIKGNAEELFTPFQTSKEVGQGTGLGLSVVHGIVHEHGGHVRAQNRAEGGARFSVYLPQLQTPLPVEGKGKRILLIEDDASVASYLQSLLDDEAYQTTFARMPTEALQTFVANPDAFDLVITDYLMPQGTGIELAQDIHALRPDLPIIITTGNSHNINQADLDEASIAGVFEKPLNSEQLVAKIRAILAA